MSHFVTLSVRRSVGPSVRPSVDHNIFLHVFLNILLGSGLDRVPSPVEWGVFLAIRLSVHPSAPPLGHPARLEAQPARLEARPARPEAQPSYSAPTYPYLPLRYYCCRIYGLVGLGLFPLRLRNKIAARTGR